ncbi:uncharacterized protein LOC142558440 [Dermacentor variabilis]|uniref:uncharacterized protein LOC142558440 n=1 Tax=Dermacentor variabilis TaxID=34621 RepID=UPI003F5CA566
MVAASWGRVTLTLDEGSSCHARQVYFPSGFNGGCGNVVATLEDARGSGDVAMLLLLDVQSAFDRLPHEVIEAKLDCLGVTGCLRGFISAFLVGRSFHVRADDVALWIRGPRRSIAAIRGSLQRALEAVISFGGIGLSVSPAKTEALLVHPLASARLYVKQLRIANTTVPWKRQVTYLGLTIDHRLSWIPAVKAVTSKVRRVQGAVSKMQQRGRGCTVKWALRMNQAAATSILLYALPLVLLSPARKQQLERLHRSAVRSILGLPKHSRIAATLAEAGEWPLSLHMLQRALGHTDRLHRAPDGGVLLCRLRSQPLSRMGGLCQLYEELIVQRPVPMVTPPPHEKPPEVHLSLNGASKRRTPAAALQQAATGKLLEELDGRLLVYTDGSVLSNCSAAAACTIPSEGRSRQCRLPFRASSTAAELAGLHLAADLLAEDPPTKPVAVLSDSRLALQALSDHHRHGVTQTLLRAKISALSAVGVAISFHWLPSHVGIAGNEEADVLAQAAHHPTVPLTGAVAGSDFSRQRLKQLLTSSHPDSRVATNRAPKLLPENGLSRRDRSTLLRLHTGSVWTAARLHAKGRIASSACRRVCADVLEGHADHLFRNIGVRASFGTPV